VTRRHAADALGANDAARRLQPADAAALYVHADHFALLDDVDAKIAGGAGKAPRHRIVARHAAARLEAGAHDRIARVAAGVEVGG